MTMIKLSHDKFVCTVIGCDRKKNRFIQYLMSVRWRGAASANNENNCKEKNGRIVNTAISNLQLNKS